MSVPMTSLTWPHYKCLSHQNYVCVSCFLLSLTAFRETWLSISCWRKPNIIYEHPECSFPPWQKLIAICRLRRIACNLPYYRTVSLTYILILSIQPYLRFLSSLTLRALATTTFTCIILNVMSSRSSYRLSCTVRFCQHCVSFTAPLPYFLQVKLCRLSSETQVSVGNTDTALCKQNLQRPVWVAWRITERVDPSIFNLDTT
jgi:hypothetical protein